MKGFGLVRGPDGKPKVDGDPMSLEPAIIMLMTDDERAALGVWVGPLARDAQGTKRLRKLPSGGFEAVDALVALSAVYDGTAIYQPTQRIDVPVGGIINVGG